MTKQPSLTQVRRPSLSGQSSAVLSMIFQMLQQSPGDKQVYYYTQGYM